MMIQFHPPRTRERGDDGDDDAIRAAIFWHRYRDPPLPRSIHCVLCHFHSTRYEKCAHYHCPVFRAGVINCRHCNAWSPKRGVWETKGEQKIGEKCTPIFHSLHSCGVTVPTVTDRPNGWVKIYSYRPAPESGPSWLISRLCGRSQPDSRQLGGVWCHTHVLVQSWSLIMEVVHCFFVVFFVAWVVSTTWLRSSLKHPIHCLALSLSIAPITGA